MQYLKTLGSLKYESDDGSIIEVPVVYVFQSSKFLEIHTSNYSRYTYDVVNNRWYKLVADTEGEVPCKEGEIVSFSYTYRWE